jgi:glutamate N-acetyltransferase/amino-acid N-acetyltransferase
LPPAATPASKGGATTWRSSRPTTAARPAAAVFTQNKFFAPPVGASRRRLEENGGRASAIIVNSGNANAGTGPDGLSDAEAMCAALPMRWASPQPKCWFAQRELSAPRSRSTRFLAATPKLARKLSAEGAHDAAKGILTTDHETKEVVISGSSFTLGGMAKGCGMIAPNMATMLAFLTTDAEVGADEMKAILLDASDRTFNTLNVDGATSTNDTVILLASGRRGRPDLAEFADAVHRACEHLTFQMARDAEGMTKMVTLRVTGAASDAEARIAAKNIAENNLVKCSWYGGDPYWGPPPRRRRLVRHRFRGGKDERRLWRHRRLPRRHALEHDEAPLRRT